MLGDGLAERIGARYAGRIDPPPYDEAIDAETGVRNARAIASWTPRLADAIEGVLERDEFPIVLGGDCSIVLGATLALRRRGAAGLLFVDGHADFDQPGIDGEAASMDLALATGHGPSLLTDLEGRRPLVRAEDTVLFGYRDAAEQRARGGQPLPRDLLAIDLAEIRRDGVAAAIDAALAHLDRPELDGFFIHVDADCLADDLMPAVDYRMPGGLRWDELETTLGAALATGRALGLEVTIFNPSLDRDGSIGRRLTQALADALGMHPPDRPSLDRISEQIAMAFAHLPRA